MNNKEFQEKLAKASQLARELARALNTEQSRSQVLAWALVRDMDMVRNMDMVWIQSLEQPQSLEQSQSWALVRSLELALELEQGLERERELTRELIKILEELQPTAPKPSEEPITDSLELTIEVPENVSDEELRDILRQAALHADSVHRSYGGKGLKIDAVEVFKESRVPGGVK